MELGNRLKDLLDERGMTVKGLAVLSGVPVNTIYAITKQNGAKTARLDTLNKIADAFSISLPELLYGKTTSHNVSVNGTPTSIIEWPEGHPYSSNAAYEAHEKFILNAKSLETSDPRLTSIWRDFETFNNTGKDEAEKRVNELTKIDEYTRPETEDN